MTRRRVVVIGGGLIGTACAAYLHEAGWEVLVVERDRIGAACSYGNCGLLALSHVLPLNAPGAIAATLRAMLRPNSPFFIKPRLDVGLWKWLLQFALRCRPAQTAESARVLAGLLQSTAGLYETLLNRDEIVCEWQRHGCLYAFQKRSSFEEYAAIDQQLERDFGVAAERLEGAALTAFEPGLVDGLPGGWFYPNDSHLRPDRLTASWRAACEARGVVFREGVTITDFVGPGGPAAAVRTADGEELRAEAFVVATGALAPRWSAQLGCAIPVQPGKGYSLTFPHTGESQAGPGPRRPVIFHDHKVVLTPMPSCVRLGSTMEFAGYDESIRERRLQILRDAAKRYLRDPLPAGEPERWFGWRAMTTDGCPIIGPTPARPNVCLATGHNMLGLTLAPVTGKLVAEMLSGQTPHLDPAPLSPLRL
jgi:D-amino-acid dehydrogenase